MPTGASPQRSRSPGARNGSGSTSARPRPPQQAADLAAGLLAGVEPARCAATVSAPARDAVVAPVAGDLLDDVDLDLAVVAPRRDGDVVVGSSPSAAGTCVQANPIGSSSARTCAAVEVGAEQRVDPGRAGPHRSAGRAARPARRPRRARRWRRRCRRPARQKRAAASGMPSGSQPFSKRADASVRRPSRRDVRLTAHGWNQAISSSTSVVAALISHDGAAHDPGDADRVLARRRRSAGRRR